MTKEEQEELMRYGDPSMNVKNNMMQTENALLDYYKQEFIEKDFNEDEILERYIKEGTWTEKTHHRMMFILLKNIYQLQEEVKQLKSEIK